MPDNKEMILKTDLAMIGELRKVLKRLHYPLEVMLVCARWGSVAVSRVRQYWHDPDNLKGDDKRAAQSAQDCTTRWKLCWFVPVGTQPTH